MSFSCYTTTLDTAKWSMSQNDGWKLGCEEGLRRCWPNAQHCTCTKKERRGGRDARLKEGVGWTKTDCSVSARTPQPVTGGEGSKAGTGFLQLLAYTPVIKGSHWPLGHRHSPVKSDGLHIAVCFLVTYQYETLKNQPHSLKQSCLNKVFRSSIFSFSNIFLYTLAQIPFPWAHSRTQSPNLICPS